MADYSFVRNAAGTITGIWLLNPKMADDPFTLMFLLTKSKELSGELMEAISNGGYRVVKNEYDKAGGCFLMFGRALAPGESG